MKFENSKYFSKLKCSKIEFDFGNYYLFDQFVISELNEGIHFNWEKIQKVSSILLAHYGNTIKIGYIANRIHSYSIEPLLWIKFQKEYDFIIASAIISYNDLNFINATLEKRFFQNSLKRCSSIDEAVNWVRNLKEFN
ncbi:hypothetical protein A9Q86_13030 [Flavobacteriales bacterium 33_180_T64]|nr:hypothetical protein A9Q86_13030 [Flavobacteriales bacterium 33_180_T64]